MLGATAVVLTALTSRACAATPKAALSSCFLNHRFPPPVISAASRNYARMRNRSPPAVRKAESEPDSSSSSDEEEAVVKHVIEDDDGLDSEELECFVMDFGAGEEDKEKRAGEDA